MASFALRRGLARALSAVTRWRLVPEAEPPSGARVVLGAPHTSNFDFLLMLALAWQGGLHIHWLGKRELFRGLGGPIMRALGGLEVDRSNPAGVVDEVVERARADDRFILVVTPEGSRTGTHWRSGFYRIAMGARLPVSLGYADGSTRTAGIGPTITLTGDVAADMDVIRDFYRDKSGVRTKYRIEPRMRDESGLPSS